MTPPTQLSLFDIFAERDAAARPDPPAPGQKRYAIIYKVILPGRFRKKTLAYYFVKPFEDDNVFRTWLESKNKPEGRSNYTWTGEIWGKSAKAVAAELQGNHPALTFHPREVL